MIRSQVRPSGDELDEIHLIFMQNSTSFSTPVLLISWYFKIIVAKLSHGRKLCPSLDLSSVRVGLPVGVQVDGRARIDLSAQQLVLDIDGILT